MEIVSYADGTTPYNFSDNIYDFIASLEKSSKIWLTGFMKIS